MLRDVDGTSVEQRTTEQQGGDAVGGLAPGEYTVVEVTPLGLFDGAEHVGTVAGAAVGTVIGNDTIGRIVLGSGQVGVDYDFCEHLGAELSGFVYYDANNNGVRESGENPIANVAVELVVAGTTAVATFQGPTPTASYHLPNGPAGKT